MRTLEGRRFGLPRGLGLLLLLVAISAGPGPRAARLMLDSSSFDGHRELLQRVVRCILPQSPNRCPFWTETIVFKPLSKRRDRLGWGQGGVD
jgi:hypothetical protein